MRKYLFLFIIICFSSCEANELVSPEKEVDNPVQSLDWLKAIVQPAKENVCTVSTVESGNYQGQLVYLISVGGALCCPCAGRAVYNEKGELVLSCNLEEEAKIREVKLVWQRP